MGRTAEDKNNMRAIYACNELGLYAHYIELVFVAEKLMFSHSFGRSISLTGSTHSIRMNCIQLKNHKN